MERRFIINTQRDLFKKGCIELLILALLAESDKYGYDLVQEISQRSEGTFSIKEGSMYPTLYRLEDRGYISSQKVQIGKRQTRVYYHLEETGRKYFQELKESYYDIHASVCRILEYKS